VSGARHGFPATPGLQSQTVLADAGAHGTSRAAMQAAASAAGSHASRWTVSGENAGRQTAMYSAPSGVE
jgi:hypothetical protein